MDKINVISNSYDLLMTYECMLFHLHHNLFYNDSQSFQPHLCTKHLLNNCEHQYPGIRQYLYSRHVSYQKLLIDYS